MGLQASMWSSVSGLLAHGEKMNVISNNLSNVSTIGFKSQRMDFEDYVYQDKFSGGGATQVGLGVGINTIIGDFSQGALESTNSATDLAITGTGYFKVVNQATGSDFYTRAGNFNFNSEGYLTLPSGEVLQGWKVNNNTTPLPATGVNPVVVDYQGIQTIGEPTDIVMDTWTVAPRATTKVEFSVNLTAEEGLDESPSATNPLFAMSDNWDGLHAIQNPGDPALSEEAYTYLAPMKVYDESGMEHTLTCYFDQVPKMMDDPANPGTEIPVIDGLPTGYEVYEYMLTMDPTEDARTFGGTYTDGVLTGATSFQDTEAAGILMKGTMIFDASGNLVTQSAYTYMGNADTTAAGDTLPDDPTDPASWQPTAVSDEGYPLFTANFSGHPMGNAVVQRKEDNDETKNKDAEDIWIEFDLGLQSENPSEPWAMGGDPATPVAGETIADLINAAPGGSVSYDALAVLVPNERATGSSTMRGTASTINFSSQDGYGSGNLTNVQVDADGVVYGIYSNGVNMPLYQVAMYDFVNPQGLYREGGNLFSETMESGSVQLAQAGIAGMGTVNSYYIENSNVDMSREFVNMIITQRGFQGNSKGIMTVDELLNTVIGMKR